MKNAFAILLLVFCMMEMKAQESNLKIGVNLNAWMNSTQTSGYNQVRIPVSPGFNISYEKPFGKKFSFTYNFDVARSNAYVNEHSSHSSKLTQTILSFSPEVRYYPLKIQGMSGYRNQGLFIQAGVKLLKFTSFKNPGASGSYFSGGEVGGNNSFIGMGIKYPFNDKTGMEMHINTSPYQLINGEGWQTLQAGFKFYWLIDKSAKKKNAARAGADYNIQQ